MYRLNTYVEKDLTMYQLHNQEKDSWITVCPERGGIITAFGVAGKEQLYLNEDTLYDRSRNIRGGIPILFPISGQVENGQYQWNGKTYEMPNHGVARTIEWEVLDTKIEEEQASITLRLTSNERTKEFFPFEFELIFTYIVSSDKVIIAQSYRNLSKEPMPVHAGFHPYFPAKTKTVSLNTDATKYLDYNDHQIKSFTDSIDLEGLKESVTLLDAEKRRISARIDASAEMTMETGSEFPYTILWTEKDKPFVCIEPWMAKNDEFNNKEELKLIPGGESLDTFVSFQINIETE